MHLEHIVNTDAPGADHAASVRRGVARHLTARGYAPLAEFKLGNGRRADVAGLDRAGRIVIVEIKISLADFRGDRKWPLYLAFCDLFYFAVPPDFPRAALARADAMPERTGVMIADAYGAAVMREARAVTLNAARRRAETLRFARKAAARLQHVCDPGFGQSWKA